MSNREEQKWVAEMLRRLERSDARRRLPQSDSELVDRCRELSASYLDGIARPRSVRWVPAMRSRWASCSPGDATIRIGEPLRSTPKWVLDYVLVHELTHLLVPGHGPDFWEWVNRYPRTERAIGFLQGMSLTAGLGMDDPCEFDDGPGRLF